MGLLSKITRNIKKRFTKEAPKKIYTPTKKQIKERKKAIKIANPIIRATEKEYRKAGKTKLPQEVAGGRQTRRQWSKKNEPYSISDQFATEKEFKIELARLKYIASLGSYEEYKEVQQDKIIKALESSDIQVTDELEKAVEEMSVPEMNDFWRDFSKHATRMGHKFSSKAVMDNLIEEYFGKKDKFGVLTGFLRGISKGSK